jgi:hypothetical protein
VRPSASELGQSSGLVQALVGGFGPMAEIRCFVRYEAAEELRAGLIQRREQQGCPAQASRYARIGMALPRSYDRSNG